MSDKALDLSKEFLKSLRELDPGDVDLVLAVLNTSFPKMVKVGYGEYEESKKPKAKASPSSPATAKSPRGLEAGRETSHKRGNKGERGGDAKGKSKSDAQPKDEQRDVLPGVLLRLTPVIGVLPEVSRDPAADRPKMDRKSVQKRLNSKRAELSKALDLLTDGRSDYYAFESCNKIQAFRLSAKDAFETMGVRLRTDPLPGEFLELVDILKGVAKERRESEQVSDYGFLENNDHHYLQPAEEDDVDPGIE